MFISNREARQIMAIPADERTPEQAARLAAWQSIDPEYDAVEPYRD